MNRYFGLHILEGEWHSLLPRYLLLAGRVDGRRILDIGCGSGIGASLLLELGASMVDAIDHRPAVLELARMKHAKHGLDFHVMFWEELDFPDDTFDMVLCLDPSSPVTDPSLLQEVDRVLKSGGEYVCAIERKPIDGLEVLLPRYGYADAAESIDLHPPTERPPQVGELQKFFATSAAVVQRPVLSFVFDRPNTDGETVRTPTGAPESGAWVRDGGDDSPHWVTVDDQLRQRDADEAAVEVWFCGDDTIAPPPMREVRLPYYSLVERLNQVINELQMRQIRGQHEMEPLFDEILDDGPSEVFERERENTNEYRVVELMDTPTKTRIKTLRDDLGDYPTLARTQAGTGASHDGLEAQLSELSALYQQVRHEFQTVVRDAQTALEERDRYIEHLVGTVQRWQDRFDSEGEEVPDEPASDLEEGTTVYQGSAHDDEHDSEPAESEASEAPDEPTTHEDEVGATDGDDEQAPATDTGSGEDFGEDDDEAVGDDPGAKSEEE